VRARQGPPLRRRRLLRHDHGRHRPLDGHRVAQRRDRSGGVQQRRVLHARLRRAPHRRDPESIGADSFPIREPGPRGGQRFHLGHLDFDALARFFKKTKHKASAVEGLTAAIGRRVEAAVRANPTRGNLGAQLEAMIAEYNQGKQSPEKFFADLVAFLKKLEAEEQRGEAEGLDPERLALYDLLRGALPSLSTKDAGRVKAVAEGLPAKLAKKLVIDWRKSQRGRAAVRAAVEDALEALPEAYGPPEYQAAVAAAYEHVFESYWGDGRSKYTEAAGS
jgi:type I restriction enzyme R subunit